MVTPVKFMFDTSFESETAKNARNRRPVNEVEVEVEPQVFTAAELKAAREDGHAQGVREGAETAGAAIEAEISRALEQIGTRVNALAEDMQQTRQQIGKDATELALAIAHKLSSTLVAKAPIAELESMITSCLSEQQSELRIVARVSEQMIDAITDRVDRITGQSGFLGDLVLLPDNNLEGSACRVEWADGGAERNPHTLATAVDAAVHSFIEASYPEASDRSPPVDVLPPDNMDREDSSA